MKYFITDIEIRKIRHLGGINIPLSKSEAKHLILTGKNGSGKTSVLEQIRNFLSNIQNGNINNFDSWQQNLNHFQDQLQILKQNPNQNPQIEQQISQTINNISSWEQNIKSTSINEICLNFTTLLNLVTAYQTGKFILAYFGANRISKMSDPQGPNKFEPAVTYQIDASNQNAASTQFLQYLVNLKTQKSFAVSESKTNSQDIIQKIDTWFSNFEKLLQQIFSDDTLILDFDYVNYKFYIQAKDREKFTLNELSSGYSAVIAMVTELMLRMEKNHNFAYDVEGIVLIDEIETHLHVELQKNILPILTTFFPNVQFIVTSHSPFVLQSVDNAVIYDLENRILVEDLSSYSWDGIVENYFDVDQYSTIVKQKMQRYEELKQKEQLIDTETDELKALENSLLSVGKNISPELATHVKQLIVKYGRANV
jgi:predicted ATP-binding protein involved in virulence